MDRTLYGLNQFESAVLMWKASELHSLWVTFFLLYPLYVTSFCVTSSLRYILLYYTLLCYSVASFWATSSDATSHPLCFIVSIFSMDIWMLFPHFRMEYVHSNMTGDLCLLELLYFFTSFAWLFFRPVPEGNVNVDCLFDRGPAFPINENGIAGQGL